MATGQFKIQQITSTIPSERMRKIRDRLERLRPKADSPEHLIEIASDMAETPTELAYIAFVTGLAAAGLGVL